MYKSTHYPQAGSTMQAALINLFLYFPSVSYNAHFTCSTAPTCTLYVLKVTYNMLWSALNRYQYYFMYSIVTWLKVVTPKLQNNNYYFVTFILLHTTIHAVSMRIFILRDYSNQKYFIKRFGNYTAAFSAT